MFEVGRTYKLRLSEDGGVTDYYNCTVVEVAMPVVKFDHAVRELIVRKQTRHLRMNDDEHTLTPKANRKLRRRIVNDRLAAEARFWKRPRSADQMGHDKPVDRQAGKELHGRASSKRPVTK
jgi:hypothetical protein